MSGQEFGSEVANTCDFRNGGGAEVLERSGVHLWERWRVFDRGNLHTSDGFGWRWSSCIACHNVWRVVYTSNNRRKVISRGAEAIFRSSFIIRSIVSFRTPSFVVPTPQDSCDEPHGIHHCPIIHQRHLPHPNISRNHGRSRSIRHSLFPLEKKHISSLILDHPALRNSPPEPLHL